MSTSACYPDHLPLCLDVNLHLPLEPDHLPLCLDVNLCLLHSPRREPDEVPRRKLNALRHTFLRQGRGLELGLPKGYSSRNLE